MKIELYPPQKQALMSPATEILYGGALGGGKSYLARAASIIYSVQIPGLITYLFRRTFKEVLANHIHTPGGYLEMLHDFLESGDVVWNKSDNAFSWWNGSRIQLAHCQYEQDIFAYQGAQIGFLIIDEATHFSPAMIRFIRSRLRLGSLVVPDRWKEMFPRILYTGNPGGIGHSYMKSNFVDFGKNKQFRAPEDEGGMLREYVPAKLRDNVIMLRADPEYEQRVKGMGSAEMVQAMIEGDWSKVDGGMFSDLWKPEFHVIEPFDIPHTWTIMRGYDYGSSAPGAYGLFAESDGAEHEMRSGATIWYPKGEIIMVGEIYFADKKHHGLRKTPRETAKWMRQYDHDSGYAGRVVPGPADNAIFHSEPGHTSVADEMSLEGITFVRGDKSPGSRISGCSIMRQKLKNASGRRELPGFRVFSNCVQTIRTVPNLERDDKKDGEDVQTVGEDHFWDIIRYRLLYASVAVAEIPMYGT